MIVSVKEHGQIIYDINILDVDLENGLEVLIGREEDCHIQLASPSISRYHAKVFIKERLQLEVISNYGGVVRNGVEASQFELIEGDTISIGGFELDFSKLPTTSTPQQQPAPADHLPPDFDENVTDGHESQTEQLERVAEETIHIPQELEEMMSEYPQAELDEFEDNDLQETEFLALEDEDLGETEMLAAKLNEENDLADSLLEDDLDSFQSDFESDLSDGVSDTESEDFQVSESDESFGKGDESSDLDNFEGTDADFNGDFEDADGFEEDSGFSSDDSGATQVFQSFAKFKLRIFGEYAPFDTFIIDTNEVKIGRDSDQCQIVLNDPEVSKVHAVIKKTLVNCLLLDNDSSNGIIWNGERTQKAELSNGDEFIIGDTTFTVEILSDIIEAEKDVLMPVEDEQEVEIEEIVEEEVDFNDLAEGEDFGGGQEEKSLFKKIWKDPRKRFYLLVGGVGLFLLLLLSPDQSSKKKVAKKDKKTDATQKEVKKPKFDEQTLEKLEQNYSLALAYFENGEYSQAKQYIDTVMEVDPEYKDSATLAKLIAEGITELDRLAKEEAAKKARMERQIKVNELVEKAKLAVKERNGTLAFQLFNEVFKLDPENLDIPALKLEMEAYQAEQAKIKADKAREAARRQAVLDQLKPGKSAYLQEEWYQAVEKLDKFIKTKGVDEDLLKEASEMLKLARGRLSAMINPLISKARSFKEGQDLKQAYETYGEVLKLNPTNEEALNERDMIFTVLYTRSKKVFREALIAESLSLFPKAKEKFQEVQQISPINSEYYMKATEKLKGYLE